MASAAAWLSLQPPSGQALHEGAAICARAQRAAVALGGNDLLRQHRGARVPFSSAA
jgi:hypothetical protein